MDSNLRVTLGIRQGSTPKKNSIEDKKVHTSTNELLQKKEMRKDKKGKRVNS